MLKRYTLWYYTIPIYLTVISCIFASGRGSKHFLQVLLTTVAISALGIFIGYFNWGISTGHLFSPDSETVLLIKTQIYIASAVIAFGWAVGYAIKRKRSK